MLGVGVAAGLLALVLTLVVVRMQAADADVAHDRPLLLADAYGLGGFEALPAPPSGAATGSPLRTAQVVTYYGTLRTPSMGILGQHDPETVADLLAGHASRFDALNGDQPVVAALHLVYAIAQPEAPGDDGLYLRYVDDRTVRRMLQLARRRGFVLILDLQIGHSTPLAEVEKIRPFLAEPDVHVALDPEFALSGPHLPGDAIGSIHARDINAVQDYLAALTSDLRLPAKMLAVHQFQPEMILDAHLIERRSDVDLVIDMDGYGPADIKAVKYERYAAAPYAPFPGIKIFPGHDDHPMTEQQILELSPRPALIVYQ